MQIPHGASRIDLPRSGSYGRVGGVEPTRSANLPSRHFAATMLGGASRSCEFDHADLDGRDEVGRERRPARKGRASLHDNRGILRGNVGRAWTIR